MKSRRIVFLVSTACLALAARSETGRKTVTFDIPDAVVTTPWAINLEGRVTGRYFDSNFIHHGFVRDPNGAITTFDVPGAGTKSPGSGTAAFAINRAGAITGNVTTDQYNTYGFIRTPEGKFIVFSAPKADPYIGCTCAETINDRGDVAGNVIDSGNTTHGFLRTAEGNITTYEVPAIGAKPAAGTGPGQGTIVNYSNSLNNAGYIVGFYIDSAYYDRSYLRAPDGTITVFEAPLSAPNEYMGEGSNTQGTVGQSINSTGTICGITIDKFGVWHGFKLASDGTYTLFDAPNAASTAGGGTPLGWGTVPEAINDRGEISGYFTDNNDVVHAFLVSPAGKITPYDVEEAGTDGTQQQGTYNFNINGSGKITGFYVDANNVTHGYVRMPSQSADQH
jgi:probable HAF family extracellular repeat protein